MRNTRDRSHLVETLTQIIIAYDLSLRQAERIVVNVVLAQIDFSKSSYRPSVIVALLAAIKAQDPAMFADIKRSRVYTARLQAFIARGDWPDDFPDDQLLNIIRYHSDPDIDENDSEFEGYKTSFWRYNFGSRLDILPYLANAVIDRFGSDMQA